MSRHTRVDQRVMRRGPMFGWMMVRPDGTAVYSDPLKKDTRSSRRLLRELLDIYAPSVSYRHWLPDDDEPKKRPAGPVFHQVFARPDPTWPGFGMVNGVPIFTADHQLNLEALKADGWHEVGAIKEDEIVTALRHDVDITNLKEVD